MMNTLKITDFDAVAGKDHNSVGNSSCEGQIAKFDQNDG